MKFTNMHLFLIICFSGIVSISILFIIPIWACSLACFISIIAFIYMLNDYLEERSAKRAMIGSGEDDSGVSRPLDESYPEWHKSGGDLTAQDSGGGTHISLPRKKVILLYMKSFGIDEVRAVSLYDAGYRSFTAIGQARLDELIDVKGINPTLAKRIQRRAVEQR